MDQTGKRYVQALLVSFWVFNIISSAPLGGAIENSMSILLKRVNLISYFACLILINESPSR
jgi:hypothetical protein